MSTKVIPTFSYFLEQFTVIVLVSIHFFFLSFDGMEYGKVDTQTYDICIQASLDLERKISHGLIG